MPKVSVIIPTHNRAEFLHSAITSVRNQTFQDFEIIVVDDASTDNTPEVVAYFGDKRIKYTRNNISKGDAGARNVGVMSSNCTYIAFLDDDDEWLKNKLQMQIDILENCLIDIAGVYTNIIEVDKASGKTLSIGIPGNTKDPFHGNCIATSSLLLRRECFEKVGLFDENMPTSSDYDMWIRILKKFRFEYIDEPLVKYYVHGNRLSFDNDKVIRGVEILLKKHREILASNNKHYSEIYLYLGIHYCYNGNINKGRRAYLKAIRLYPYELRSYFNLFLSLTGVSNFKRLRKTKENIINFLKEHWIRVNKGSN